MAKTSDLPRIPDKTGALKMPIVDAVKPCFAKYADFEGRATRTEYWWFFLAVLLAGVTASVITIRLDSRVALVSLRQ